MLIYLLLVAADERDRFKKHQSRETYSSGSKRSKVTLPSYGTLLPPALSFSGLLYLSARTLRAK